MTTSQKLLLGSALLLAGCTGASYHADVGAMFARVDGQVALQNAGGSLVLHDNTNEIGDQLGADDTEVAPYIRGQMDKDKHRVRVHGFAFDSEGTGTLAGDFGGIPAGSAISSKVEFWNIGGSYAYELARNEQFRFALGGQLGVYSLDTAVRSSIGREEVETDLIVPMPYLEIEGFLGPVTVGANGGLMAIDLADGNGRYIDTEAYARWQATEDFEVIAGYRYILMDAHGTASSRDFDSDVYVQGFFLGAGIRF